MTITIALPAYNEARTIVRTLQSVFQCIARSTLRHTSVTVVVADNGSTDATARLVASFAQRERRLVLLSVPVRGKGNAVFTAWQRYPADIMVFLDADLSADIAALPELIRLVAEGADIAVASRFAAGAVVTRSYMRRAYSRFLRILLWLFFRLHVRDAPCGMKAIARRAAEDIIPTVRDRQWFFDTELLVRAERGGYRIVEVPVRWSDVGDRDRPSSVGIFRVMAHYLTAMIRLRVSLRA